VFIKFEQFELLEAFDAEEVINKDEESYRYSLELEGNFCFVLSLNSYAQTCSIGLKSNNLQDWIYNINFSDIYALMLHVEHGNKYLYFFKSSEPINQADPFFKILIYPKPYFNLNL
jgi:hypothetical protein